MADLSKININAESVINQYYAEQQQLAENSKKKTAFDPKNYLNARLAPGETTKTLTIRLLPYSLTETSPFHKVFIHSIRVNKEVASSGWKLFVCPTHNKLGDDCPFCNLSSEARRLRFESQDEQTKKKYGDIEYANKVKEFWAVRCIERGHEDEGVKFWLFSHSKKKDGVFDKIMNLFETRKKAAERRGDTYNIFDLFCGQDLIITLSRTSDGKTTVQVVDEGVQSPLAETEEKMLRWINDEKKLEEVYTVKSPDYMRIIAEGGVPVYDKALQKFVNKLEQTEDTKTAEQPTETTQDYTTVNTTVNTTVEEDLPF